ncbi:T9SS type B sorting domain-containing protein [Confluentibacter sediminis]|uniref:T9SS type B sorting domain-containing protein n=1 Tax=Confluentibacter sediminis TaxID=2219045 RepID=UPI000DAB90FE|nr:T9SS type B sorting domain-containing protein [Confluentibacter sediminis]
MKKPTHFKIVFAILMLFLSIQSFAQNLVPFVTRYDEAIKGDMLLIGNSNLSVHPTDPYNYTGTNSSYNNEGSNNKNRMVYVDIDGDNATFNSSSADLDVPNTASCYQIVYAGLYWSSVVSGTTPMANIKFKTPGSSAYVDITGTQIYYQNSSDNRNSNTYVYYRDVTDILSTLSNPEGTYTVANISSMTSAMMNSGSGLNTEGLSAGWSLFVIYEDPLLPSKYITSFDGFTKIDNQAPNNEQTFPINGFQTIPTGPVRAKYAFSALEGDRAWSGDYLQINGTSISATTVGGTTIRPSNNFFNSSVSIIDPNTNAPVLFTDRNPESANTLGFDAGIINIPNADKSVIANGATSANIKLGTNTDIYYFYFSAFAIEIIAPNIVLTKIVEDAAGNDIGGQVVDLGDELNYVIGFQNTGNDNATDMTIRDILPTNVVFNYPSDIDLLPAGVTVKSYNPTTRELIFNIDESVVKEKDPVSEIRFKVTVVSTCSLLSDACSNSIDNQAYSTYKGTINSDFTISDDPSYASNTGCLLTPGATNFLADLNDCTFEENIVLCGSDVVLTAGEGYDAYSWSTSPSGTPVIGTNQSITVTSPGTYYVHNTATAPCQSIDQIFEVITYGAGVTNPVLPFADEVVICPNDGKELPNIFLCGANDSRFIQTNITDTSSMIWEKLDESSCSAVVDQDCANESDTCTWNQVATGPDYLADTAGQYKLTLNYTGGCYNEFYFNVYENLLIPKVTPRDIFCTTPGQITVNNVPSGYLYSIDGVNYQTENVFVINTPNVYTVYVKQDGVTPNPCIFTVPAVQIRQRDFTVSTIITQPLCHDELGSVTLAANDVRPQYYFSIYQGATEVDRVGPIMENSHPFLNLNPGTYTVNVSTDDGCTFTDTIEIINPPLLTATSALTTPLTCTDGEITVYPSGGTAPYYYFVNGSTEFQSTPQIPVTAPGRNYNITVVDANDCSVTTSITVYPIPAPEYTVDHTDILCYNSNDGVIHFNVTNANGYTVAYSIDNGATYSANPTFSNLSPGDYLANIRYSLNGVECFSATQTISITQPDSAVTASAGVSKLACDPSGEGRLRITNPQGGKAPYEYSFDNQATWTTTNEADVAPGTYTLYIRDANGCIFPMTGITLDPVPVAPTIDISDPDFNCDGSANATVTVTNSGTESFNYRYLLDGVENTNTTDPTVFLNVPDGTHTVTVEYVLSTVPTYSNLLYETFGYGDDTTSPGINTAYYCFERQVVATQCKGSIQINDGDYSVTSHIVSPFAGWVNPVDHTPPTNPVTPKGRYLVVNIGASIPKTEILYEKQINDIIPNQPINVEFYAMNLVKSPSNIYDPNLLVALVDGSGTEISSFTTGNIPKSGQWENYPKTPMTLNPGANTSLKFIVRSNVQQTSGNDVAIDDIRVYQLPESCVTTVDFPFIVASGNAFTADIIGFSNISCSGSADGSITISAQNFDPAKGFQYSIDNGVTWNTQMTSPYTITGLAPTSYNIQIRYDDVTTGCSFPFTQDITEPNPVEVTVSGTPVTCLMGSTVTASATGGSPAYSYELIDASLNSIPFPSSGILTDIAAGDYIVKVTDANGCSDTERLNLVAPEIPELSISNTSDYCYDATDGATLVVDASGGQAPYEYSINGNAFQTSNTFSNLTPGTYTLTVRDAYGCTDTLSETIEPQLTASAVLTKDLDCVSPGAIIEGTIFGGYAPYTYSVSVNGAAYGAPVNVVGTTFSYTTSTDGTYRFLITDANANPNGCTFESREVLVAPISYPEISSISATDNLCYGDNNGSIQITINNTVGTPPFVINVYNDTTGFNYGTQTTGLPAGDYTVTLTDGKGCTDVETITINQPTAIDFDLIKEDITCNNPGGSSLGSITIQNVTGGTAPFTYFITNNFGDVIPGNPYSATSNENHTFNIINYGVYTINVIDSNGCSLSKQETIASPPSDLSINIDTSVPDCTTGGTATVQAISPLGSGNYEFGILEFNTAPYTLNYLTPDVSTPDTRTFTNLTPGIVYTFVVHDLTTDCYFVKSADFAIPAASTLTSSVIPNNVVCQGENNGSVTFTIDNFDSTTTSVDYGIYTAYTNVLIGSIVNLPVTFGTPSTVTTPSPGSLAPGQYYLVFTENGTGSFNGCKSASVIFEINESAIDLSITASVVKNANCNPSSGVISAIARDGTAPYVYQLTTSATPPLTTDPSWASSNTFNRDAGSYYAHVKDAYGCIKTALVTVLPQDPEPVLAAVVVSNQCTAVEGGFTIDVSLTTSGIAPHSFSIDGGAFQTRTAPFTISNLSSGTHTVEVKDSNGCGNLVSVDIVPPVSLTPTVTTLPSCSDDDGVITVTGSGGSGNYSFAISPSAGSITSTATGFSGVPSGTYTITVTDTTTGCTKPATVTLEAATPVTFTTTPTDVSCYLGSDGTITVNLPAGNDNPVYTYEITAPIIVAPQTSNVFAGLAAGTYTVVVTSGRGCVETDDVKIGQPADIVVSDPTVNYECTSGKNSSNSATITVNSVKGGSGAYTRYEFIKDATSTQNAEVVQSGPNNVYTETNLSGGNYTINVYDNKGCMGTTTIELFVSISNLNVAVIPITCAKGEDITVSVTSSGVGTPDLRYTVKDIVGSVLGAVYSQTNTTKDISADFTDLPVGNYIITVENLDTGCSLQTTHYVSNPNTFDLAIDPPVDVTCFSASDGSVKFTFIDRSPIPTDESGPFSYDVFNVTDLVNPVTSGTTSDAGPVAIPNLAAGTYEIIATLINSPYCEAKRRFTITGPTAALAIAETHTEITCVSGNNDGTISASATGGWPGGYEYELSGTTLLGDPIPTIPYSSNGTFTNLSAGNYTVSVRNSNSRGCTDSKSFPLINPKPIIVNASSDITMLSCFGAKNATITVDLPTGGQGSNYSYTLNTIFPTVSSSGPQLSPVFSGLGAGKYSITVTDGFSCSGTLIDNIVIEEPAPVQASLVKATSQTCLTQSELTLSATGGTERYEYSDSATFGTILGSFTSASPITFPVPVGTYQYYVRDRNGCEANVSNKINIDPLPALIINFNEDNPTINCKGDNTGVIVAVAQGGLGNYVYTLLDGSGNPIQTATQNSPGVFTGLLAGDYKVQVTSVDCEEVREITISEPTDPFVARFDPIPASCFGKGDGRLEITASGGTGIIKYAISPQMNQFFDTPVFENLYPGHYQGIAQDEQGCFVLFDFTIEQPDPIQIAVVPSSIEPELCEGDMNAAFSVEISGGNMPYSVAIDDMDGPYVTGTPTQTVFPFSGLSGGDHTVYVIDGSGCDYELVIPLPESVSIQPLARVDYGCDNNISNNTVTVSVTGNANAADLSYSLDNGPYQTSNVFINVISGQNHYIDVMHTNGCTKRTQLFDVEEYDPLEVSLEDGAGLNEIVAVTTGGSGVYQYDLNGEDYGSTNSFLIYKSGDYTVTVTDSNGCVATATKYFEYIDVCIPNYFTPDNNTKGWGPGCASQYKNLTVDIFDRYGRKIATLRVGDLWNGLYNGKELPTGDYWYVLKLNDPKDDRDFVGHFTLYR